VGDVRCQAEQNNCRIYVKSLIMGVICKQSVCKLAWRESEAQPSPPAPPYPTWPHGRKFKMVKGMEMMNIELNDECMDDGRGALPSSL
jgi:hypothetical protein